MAGPARVAPLISLALGVVIIAALSLAGSIVLASTANGIAIFMLFGAGLTAGLLGQIAEALNSDTPRRRRRRSRPGRCRSRRSTRLASAELTADTVGFTRWPCSSGPLGGARDAGIELWLWSLAYLAAVIAGGLAAFNRRDL